MVEKNNAVSSIIPSSAVSSILYAISAGASNTQTLWEKIKQTEPGLEDFFISNADEIPVLEGYSDGLIVISWDHKCIESFQSYQAIKYRGVASFHNGLHLDEKKEPIEFKIDDCWNIVDHQFEERELEL